MDRARTKAVLLAYLAPERPSRFVICLYALVILFGLWGAVFVGLLGGNRHFVLTGCGLMLLGEGRLLWMWNGIVGLAVSGFGMFVMLGSLITGSDQPAIFQVGAVLLILFSALIPFGIWKWVRYLGS